VPDPNDAYFRADTHMRASDAPDLSGSHVVGSPLNASRMALTALFRQPANYPFADADIVRRIGILLGDLTKMSELL
jgi:hypothetical protein